MKYDWSAVYERLRENALAGEQRRRFEFELVEAIGDNVFDVKEQEIFDFIDETVEFHAIAYNTTREQAQKTVYANLLYVVGYYGDVVAEKWRELVHKRMGLSEANIPEPKIEVVE